MMTELGILLALGCACASNVAFLCKQRGAVVAPDVEFRRPLASAAALFRSRWWTIGIGIATFGWLLHVAALAIAPLSLVQAVISGGLVLLAFPAQRWFGFRLGAREWLGLGLSAFGLAFLAITLGGTGGGDHSSYSLAPMTAFEAAAVAIGVLLLLSGRVERVRPRHGLLLGVASGLLIGVSDVSLKALTGTVPDVPLSIVSPWTLVAIGASVLAFFALARGLQTGDAIPVITLTSVAANCSAILGGVLVFGDPLGSGALEIILRSVAFAALIAAAALMPAPLSNRAPQPA
jgi:hypothetical protein